MSQNTQLHWALVLVDAVPLHVQLLIDLQGHVHAVEMPLPMIACRSAVTQQVQRVACFSQPASLIKHFRKLCETQKESRQSKNTSVLLAGSEKKCLMATLAAPGPHHRSAWAAVLSYIPVVASAVHHRYVSVQRKWRPHRRNVQAKLWVTTALLQRCRCEVQR